MQVLLAYGLDHPPDADVAPRLTRVTSHLETLWKTSVTRHGKDVTGVGMHVWSETESPWRWPVWQEDPALAVASVYRPLGYQQVVGELPPEHAALPLGRVLLDHPDRVAELIAPFVVGALEPEVGRVTLITDALGFGPLFQLRFTGGWVWSNRPAAACLFAGIRGKPDRAGWRTFAATGWFMGDLTPFEGVYAVPAGTQVGYQSRSQLGRFERRVETLNAFASKTQDPLTTERVAEVAEALRACALSLPRMRTGGIKVGLSGGRDSRLVAAAFLSAGVEVQLYTNGAILGEADVAERLVAALPKRVAHLVDKPNPMAEGPQDGPTTLERALGWHRWRDGLKSATWLPAPPPDRLLHEECVLVGGEGGGVARGNYYPSKFTELDALPRAERIERLCGSVENKIVGNRGVSPQAQRDAEWQVRRALLAATVAGIEGATALDYFYATERLRRWSSMADYGDHVAPLLGPEFLRGLFSLSPDQRKADALHRAVTAHLVPAWADMPYYHHPRGEILPTYQPRLGLAPDHNAISAIVANPNTWGDGHEVRVVQREWKRLRTGEARWEAEALIQRVIWRSIFDDYLAELNGNEPRSPVVAEAKHQLATPARFGLVHRARRFTGRVLRYAARMVDRT